MKKLSLTSDTGQTIRECFESFIVKCTVRNLSPATTATYRKHYDIFEEFIGDAEMQIDEVREQNIDDFIIHLRTYPKCILSGD